MTTQRDAERIISAWVDLMPDEAPDRVIESVLRATATTPQTRRQRRGLPWRVPPMLRAPLAIGAAAVIVVASAVLIMRPSAAPPIGGLPTPTIPPSPTAPASATPSAQLPAAIQARWMSGHRGIVADDAGTTMLIDETSIALSAAHSGPSIILTSLAANEAANRLRLETGTADAHCGSGDTGTYGWVLGQSGRSLTITTGRDDCQARAEAIAGQWWRMGCKDVQNFCLGELSAGQYRSQFINPRADIGAWVPSFGAIGFTVPDGWANSSDYPESYELMPQDSFAGTPAAPPVHDIILATRPSPLSKDAACASNPPPGVGTSVDDLVRWLDTINGLVTTEPEPITIGGFSGAWVDLRVDPTAEGLCYEGTAPLVEYMTSQPSGVIGEQRHRLILLDIGGGDVLAITIVSEDPDTFDAFVADAMPIVESVEVVPGP